MDKISRDKPVPGQEKKGLNNGLNLHVDQVPVLRVYAPRCSRGP